MRSLFLFILFCGSYLHAQTFWDDRYDYFQSGHSGQTIGVGIWQADYRNLNDHMRQLGAKTDFGKGFADADYGNLMALGGRYGESDGLITFNYIFPKTVDINDTMKCSYSGFHIVPSLLLGKDVWHSDAFDCVLSLGADFGFTFYHEEGPNSYYYYRNYFLSPSFRTDVRYVYKHFIAGVCFYARYDVTNPEWKSSVTEFPGIAGTAYSGFAAEFYIGYHPLPKKRDEHYQHPDDATGQ
ncbi:MAG TPA: hypothetical protein VL651_16455 [Bacteroidia bacterium]|jgi:hypothetical protein|nr:hypothetical protein [Bacteroidia bacterium]